MHRLRLPGRVGHQTPGGEFSEARSLPARPCGPGKQAVDRHTPRTQARTEVHALGPSRPGALNLKNNTRTLECGSLALSSRAGEPGSFSERVFAALGSRGDISGIRAALSPHASGLGRPGECKFGLNPSQEAGSWELKAFTLRPGAVAGRRAEGFLQWPGRSTQPKPLWLWSLAGNLKRVLLCREVCKCLSPFPRDLAALPDVLPSTYPTLKSSPFK